MIVATVRVGCGSYTSFWSLLANTCKGPYCYQVTFSYQYRQRRQMLIANCSDSRSFPGKSWVRFWVGESNGSQMMVDWRCLFCGKMHRGRLGPQRLICSPLMWYHMPSSSGLIGWLLAWGSRYMKNFEIEGVSLWESKGLCVCFHGNNWCGRSQEFPVFLPTQLTRNNNNSKKQWSASILQPPSAMAVGLVSSTTKINK